MITRVFIVFVALSVLFVGAAASTGSVLDNTAPLEMQENELADADFVFNLAASEPAASGVGGNQFVLNRENTKGLRLGNGANGGAGTQVLFNFKPCGFRTPHHHPRGTENFYIIEGNMSAVMIREGSGALVQNSVSTGFSGFFPQGHHHFLFNSGCSPATTISMFDNSDEGVIDNASILNFPFDTIQLTLDNQDLVANQAVAENVLMQSKACLKRCNIRREYPLHATPHG